MLLNNIKPSLFLSEYIRLYRIVDFHFPSDENLPFKMYPPRPEHCLQFYPKDTETIKYPNSNIVIAKKKACLTGQHTITNHRYVGREFVTFQVVFQPGVLYRITGIKIQELSNHYLDAEDIFGTSLRLINEELFRAESYSEMIQIVEQFLRSLIKNMKKDQHPVDVVAKLMLLSHDQYSVDNFLKESCLSHRQFDRKFKERIGIAPKQFLQVIRFDRASRMKNKFPDKDWLSVALHCGYHDYQHMAKDYKQFTGYTPTKFFEIDNKAPERFFGDAEV